jgi:hypothetical protein
LQALIHIQYEITSNNTITTFYGRLECIYVLSLAANNTFPLAAETKLAVAVVTKCQLQPDDKSLDALDVHFYSSMGAKEAVDVECLQALVGRITLKETRAGQSKLWAIIDRSGALAQPDWEELANLARNDD